jgi:hypothetical protein
MTLELRNSIKLVGAGSIDVDFPWHSRLPAALDGLQTLEIAACCA